jgi:hypothetical protein
MDAPHHHHGCNFMTNNCLRKLSMIEAFLTSSEIDSIREAVMMRSSKENHSRVFLVSSSATCLAEHAEEEQAVSSFIYP